MHVFTFNLYLNTEGSKNMITTILLIIIYLAFISLGLPDAILGVTIPALQSSWNLPLSAGGVLSASIVSGTIISSFLSGFILKRVGTGKIIFLSTLVTGAALLGFSLSPSYYWLILFAVPLGLGGGCVDVAINNYVATHFKAHHMNWLHSFWGIGATVGPVIMSWNLINKSWQSGYRTISFIQLSLALILLIAIPIWAKHHKHISRKSTACDEETAGSDLNKNIFAMAGIKYALLTMLFYCAVEIGTGLWSSSFLVGYKGFSIDKAARYVAVYYSGITIGRMLSGFVSFKLNNIRLIRYGALTSLSGLVLLLFPLPDLIIGGALFLAGTGLAPIFPAMIHETPRRFGKELSAKIIGYQMGFAYIGSAAVPPLLGLLYQNISISYLPQTMLILVFGLITISELLNKAVKNNRE